MMYYRCKCGREESMGSMPPRRCRGCSECGTNLSPSPTLHRDPEPHDFTSVEEVATDKGAFTITKCRMCRRTKAEVAADQ
jgi:hypothetical protein